MVHIDGDYLAYRCAGSSECPAGVARRNVREKVEAFRDMSGAARAVVQLSLSGSDKGERALISTVKPYQGQRTHASRPVNWEVLRVYLETHDPILNSAFEVEGWADREADDGFALASWCSQNPEVLCAIAAKDKDMRMLAGLHIDWDAYTLTVVPRGSYEVIGPHDGLVYGHKWFWLQMLQGDTADNIPGLPLYRGKKIGEKGAASALAGTTTNGEAFEVVGGGYREHYGEEWADRFVEQAGLLWLRGSKSAMVHDFLRVVPATEDIQAAAQRLIKRVRTQRAEINRITAQAREAEAGEGAGQSVPAL
ncbi:phosphodiesterase [Robbsia andropogonis]|uniref:phosphodiesterase n=1 Tax=Robbsia andropogonis TaxID=28092 RepID=UPI003D200535